MTGDQLEATSGIRPRINESLLYWCRHALAPRGMAPARHHQMLIDYLQRMEEGEFDRLMVHMPPGSAKTEYVSLLYPTWHMAREPTDCIIGASNTADLANRNGRKVRNLTVEHGNELNYNLATDAQAAGQWETNYGGEYYATGVGGTSIGRRADVMVIDDPFRSRDEVENKLSRDKVYDWYRATVIGRMKPGGKIVLMHTRWHEDDLAGRLLKDQANGADKWTILSLPAFAEANDPMGREIGEVLWPEWEDKAALERKKVVVGTREWTSQFQQRPAAPEGVLFPVDRIVRLDKLPSKIEHTVRGWDFAATEQIGSTDPDWTVGLKLVALADGRFAVIDVKRERMGPNDVENLVASVAEEDGEDVPIEIPQDPAQAGKFQASVYISKLAGYMARATLMNGSKITRSGPVVAQVEAGNLIVLNRGWTEEFLAELQSFPNGAKDDQVDALSSAFMRIVELLGSDGIIKYYDSMVRNAAKYTNTSPDGPRGPRRPNGPTDANIDNSLVDVYHQALEELRGPNVTNCSGCGKPLGMSMTTDGVDHWHQECFH